MNAHVSQVVDRLIQLMGLVAHLNWRLADNGRLIRLDNVLNDLASRYTLRNACPLVAVAIEIDPLLEITSAAGYSAARYIINGHQSRDLKEHEYYAVNAVMDAADGIYGHDAKIRTKLLEVLGMRELHQ